jgi:GNAT superfamily N-acetyltransferase
VIALGRPDDYDAFKRLLNRGRHPVFIGPNMVTRNARNGGLVFARHGGDVAAALVNPHYGILLVLCVLPEHRSHGLGSALVDYLRPNWVRAIESAVPWFRRLGYVSVGEPKQGRRHITHVMVRDELRKLAGRASQRLGQRCRCAEDARHRPDVDCIGEHDRVAESPVP